MHYSVTEKRVAAALDSRTTGFCTLCGAQAEGVEPDAQGCKCEACGENDVYGAEELLLFGALP